MKPKVSRRNLVARLLFHAMKSAEKMKTLVSQLIQIGSPDVIFNCFGDHPRG
jgi:hypothetical protein